jgi:hypothetical protein
VESLLGERQEILLSGTPASYICLRNGANPEPENQRLERLNGESFEVGVNGRRPSDLGVNETTFPYRELSTFGFPSPADNHCTPSEESMDISCSSADYRLVKEFGSRCYDDSL